MRIRVVEMMIAYFKCNMWIESHSYLSCFIIIHNFPNVNIRLQGTPLNKRFLGYYLEDCCFRKNFVKKTTLR